MYKIYIIFTIMRKTWLDDDKKLARLNDEIPFLISITV